MNRSRLKSRSLGFNIQAAFNQDVFGKKNQLVTGLGYDVQRTRFIQTEQLSNVDNDPATNIFATRDTWFAPGTRMPINLDDDVDTEVNLSGKSKTASLFATDTMSLNQFWHVTASARYNHTTVKNRDALTPTGAGSLSGDHGFNRVNPSLGLTFTPTETLSVFGSYSESNRAPTSIELGCADPAQPCKLPNAMAADPPLNQVVAKTYDFGVRGKVADNLKWNASVYRTMNHDDIHFINSTVNAYSGALGYFDNIGRTKRQGLDLGLSGSVDKLFFRAGYSFISAKYDSDLELVNEINSTSGAITDDVINVRKGNYLAGIPKHQFKLRLQYNITPQWSVGSNVVAYSDQYVQGNENNAHVDNDGKKGKLNGYTVMNLDTQYNLGQGWNVFAKAINIFDKDYYTGGRLAETMFSPAGNWGLADRGVTAVVPGAPQAAWVGVRYEFGGAPETK
jgi:outer membrane receptor protein involved in Fe transport